jgi:hypothetical protein
MPNRKGVKIGYPLENKTRRGKCNRALWELRQAYLQATMASSCILRPTQGIIRSSGAQVIAQECSLSAQVKAAAAHVQTLKQSQREKKLSLTYVEVLYLLKLRTLN